MTKEKTKTVFPGDFIATEEEFVAGRNTYEQNGEVRASIIGEVDFDNEYKEVNVRGKGVQNLRAGDVVIGRVVKKRDKMVTIQILGTEERRAVTLTTAQIPVRNASQSFVEDMRTLYKIGDFVRAKVVVATKLQVDLVTNEKGLGVVDARCNVCKKRLDYSNGKMTCLSCGNIEERKWFDAEDVRGERRDSGRSFSGNRDSRGGSRPGGFSRDRRDSRGGRDGGRNFSGPRDSRGDSRGGDRRSFSGNRPNSRDGDRKPSGRSFGGRDSGRSNFSRDKNDSRSRGGFRNENRSYKPR